MPCPAADRASFFTIPQGEVAEWLKAHAWKACLGETLTWVRIPPSPPSHQNPGPSTYGRSADFFVATTWRYQRAFILRLDQAVCKSESRTRHRPRSAKQRSRDFLAA